MSAIVNVLNLLANAATVAAVIYAAKTLDEQRVATAWSLIAAAKVENTGNIGLIDRLEGLVHSTSFKGIKLPGAHLAQISLPGVDLEGADLSRAHLVGANLHSANLNGADLRQAVLQRSDLSKAQLRGAILDESDLSGANLAGADLRGAILIKARLLSANLEGAHLELANFTGANLSDARLAGAKFDGARFDRAVMHRTDLHGTNLPRVLFRGTDFRRANLTGASFDKAPFVPDANFSNACGNGYAPDGTPLTADDRWCGPPAAAREKPGCGSAYAAAPLPDAIPLIEDDWWCDPTEAGKTPTVYYLVPTLIDEWQTESQKAIERVFSELKPHYRVITLNAHEDAALQGRQLAAAIKSEPAIIILSAVDPSKVDHRIVERARNINKTRILVYDRPIDVEVDFTAVTDSADTGEKAAQNALEFLTGIDEGKWDGKILHILGDPVDQWSRGVQIGFEGTVAKKAPRVEVISRPAMQWDPANARKIARDQFERHQDIKVVYAHSADLADAVIDVLKEKGKKPGQIKVISSNGAPLGFKNMGECSFTRDCWQQLEIDQPVYAQVHALVLFHDEIMEGKSDRLTGRTCNVLGFNGKLVPDEQGIAPDKKRGPIFILPVKVITKKDVDSHDPQFWGNMIPPEGISLQPCLP
jgi:ribose transport system substrate-binding protein